MSSSPIPAGRGSVSGAPNLPHGFTDTLASRYVVANGLRQHVVTGGEGPPLLLVHGWPQTWYSWRHVMPALALDHAVVAVDQRGIIGLTDKPAGYDTGTLVTDLVEMMDVLGHERFALFGTDTGMAIAYAVAADHPDRVERLVLAEAPLPGVSPSPPLVLPPVRRHQCAEHRAQRSTVEPAGAGDRRRRERRGGDRGDRRVGRRRRPDGGPARRRPLDRRAGA